MGLIDADRPVCGLSIPAASMGTHNGIGSNRRRRAIMEEKVMLQIRKSEEPKRIYGRHGGRKENRRTAQDRIRRHRSAGGMDLGYYYFTSERPNEDLPLFVTVHGIGRRAHQQARLFAPMIDAIGGSMIAPVFGKKQFAGYQRLGRPAKGIRADMALQRLIDRVQHSMRKPRHPVVMFGYSGGGQFVHRYAMAYPRQVKKIAIAAPGWFTLPDMRIKFPQGVRAVSALPDLNFDASRFLKISALVLVGEDDIYRDHSLNQKAVIDQRQGRNRIERAYRWVQAMQDAALRYNYRTAYEFITLPGCGHSFKDCMVVGAMGWKVVRFLYGKNSIPRSVLRDETV